jgi:predicted DNA-binding transcriptional regulator AlpA
MARPEVTGRRKGVPRLKLSTDERDAWSIPEFCARHSISRSTYYNLKKNNEAPRETRIMKKIVITRAAAAAWLKKQEKASA